MSRQRQFSSFIASTYKKSYDLASTAEGEGPLGRVASNNNNNNNNNMVFTWYWLKVAGYQRRFFVHFGRKTERQNGEGRTWQKDKRKLLTLRGEETSYVKDSLQDLSWEF